MSAAELSDDVYAELARIIREVADRLTKARQRGPQ
jgi:hypothetical protein